MQQQNIEPVMSLFAKLRKTFDSTLKNLGMESEPALTAAEDMLRTEIAPTLAYLDAPRHPMAPSLFICAMHLAVFKTVRSQDVDSHTYGVAMLDSLAAAPAQPEGSPPPTLDGPGTHAGEFQVDVLEVDDARGVWSFNITSCAICHLFGQHDAMPLVPYMCASDDVVSDKNNQGLRRTGTIALGAHQCDFRYQEREPPLRVAEQFEDKILYRA